MDIKEVMLRNESDLSEYAFKSKDGYRLNEEHDNDIRPIFFRDIDRIIYSLSYTRYMDKTQVFSLNSNDHVTKRIIHVTLVSKIARTIGRALKLNEDLIEAMALGHDIGHVPFGHIGEAVLNELSLEYNQGYFNHNIQSVRNFMYVEEQNLSIQVLDGIMCHNGEFVLGEYRPKAKTKEEFLEEYNRSYTDKSVNKHLISMTLEGCVVRISDVIGYIGRDLEDALRLNVISEEDIPEYVIKVLGKTNKSITNKIIMNIIDNSYGLPYIKMSEDIFEAINMLKDFECKYIYPKAAIYTYDEYKNKFRSVFEYNLKHINDEDSDINKIFLNQRSNKYLANTSNERKVIDYIAGMTDDFFLEEYKKSLTFK